MAPLLMETYFTDCFIDDRSVHSKGKEVKYDLFIEFISKRCAMEKN